MKIQDFDGFGDVLAGMLSQLLKSRKKVLFIFITISAGLCAVYFNLDHISYTTMYTMCFLLGLSVGYWAIFITIAAEQFGTNIRATAATTVPNFVRGASVPIMLSFKYLKGDGGMSDALGREVLQVLETSDKPVGTFETKASVRNLIKLEKIMMIFNNLRMKLLQM